jgi:hypothetical protein
MSLGAALIDSDPSLWTSAVAVHLEWSKDRLLARLIRSEHLSPSGRRPHWPTRQTQPKTSAP